MSRLANGRTETIPYGHSKSGKFDIRSITSVTCWYLLAEQLHAFFCNGGLNGRIAP